MKTPLLIASSYLVISCNNQSQASNKVLDKSHHDKNPHARISETLDSSNMTSIEYANGLISGKIKPSDNEQTIAWLDSLYSKEKSTRDFAFKVYKGICIKTDGALSEGVCGYVKSYFELYPDEFLSNLSILSDLERENTFEKISFEFYASGEDYVSDIENYFYKIRNNCLSCNEKSILDIRKKIEVSVRQMVKDE